MIERGIVPQSLINLTFTFFSNKQQTLNPRTIARETKPQMAMNSDGRATKTPKHGPQLPSELNEEIFSRLKIEDILRSRSVCKTWKALIDSPGFKKKLFEAAKNKNSSLFIWRKSFSSLEPTLHFLSPPFHNVSLSVALNLAQFLDDSAYHSSNSSSNAKASCDDDVMVLSSGCVNNLEFKKFGVVNGLVCFGWKSFHVVWNPLTKEFKRFNAPKKDWVFDLLDNCGISDDILLNGEICAFGFDPVHQDYKFLLAHFTSALTKCKNKKNKVLFQLYSVRENTWKGGVFEFPFVSQVVTGDGCMDDGKFYWFAKKCGEKREDGTFGPAVIGFDFCNEVFEVVNLPEGLASGEDAVAVANRGVLEIIMTSDDDEGLRSEVWVMENGVSWTRTLSVGLPKEVGRPIGVLRDGEMMFENPSKVDGVKELVLINPATGSCKKLGLNGTEFWMFNYVQSMFSVKQ